MAVKIRLSRIGKTHRPFNRIVAIDERAARDSQAIEILGTYDPIKGTVVTLHDDRVDYWVSQGAQFSDSAKKVWKQYKKTQKSA